jgi:hypothetical protein
VDSLCKEWARLDSNQRPDRYEQSVPKRKTAENLTFIVNIVESASMQFQALSLSCVPFACRSKKSANDGVAGS